MTPAEHAVPRCARPRQARSFDAQNVRHRALGQYVNNDRLLVPGLASRTRNDARTLASAYVMARSEPDIPGSREIVEVRPYEGATPQVRRLQQCLAGTLERDLVGAYVHGSLGSGEAVPYSDFDALVILRDAVLEDPVRLHRVARDLSGARRFMYDYDPLQHHGWFVLAESDLSRYCDAYFPRVLFHHAASLMPGGGGRLELQARESTREVRHSFEALAGNVVRQLGRGGFPRGLYDLKNILSQFMLLPALYVHVRDGEGVWKAESFDRASTDFEPGVWSSMDRVSRLRDEWAYSISAVHRALMSSPLPWGRVARKRWRVPVPPSLSAGLTPDLHEGMTHLVDEMRRRLAHYDAARMDS